MFCIAGLMLGACTSGEDAQVTAAASSTPRTAPTFPLPRVDAETSDTLEDTLEDALENTLEDIPSDTASDTASDIASDAPSAAPSSAPSATPEAVTETLGSWTRKLMSVEGRGGIFTPAQTTDRSRPQDVNAACRVAPVGGEIIHDCLSVGITSNNGRLSVVDSTDADGERAVRIFRSTPEGHTSTLTAPGRASSLVASNWPNGDNLILVSFANGERRVVEWGATGEPTIAANMGYTLGGETVSFLAGRIVRRLGERGSGQLDIFTPGADGSSGVSIKFSTDDLPPTDIALSVYEKWINGDFASMAGQATDEAIAALRRDPTDFDAFELSANACNINGEQATCTFTSSYGNSVWTLERQEGKVKVTKIARG
ncbi:MAG: hypothetical protein ACI867_002275 [Glaciecola sp.]|jgi:hypothetical protein